MERHKHVHTVLRSQLQILYSGISFLYFRQEIEKVYFSTFFASQNNYFRAPWLGSKKPSYESLTGPFAIQFLHHVVMTTSLKEKFLSPGFFSLNLKEIIHRLFYAMPHLVPLACIQVVKDTGTEQLAYHKLHSRDARLSLCTRIMW